MFLQKMDSELDLSLNLSVPERMMCPELCSGYDPETDIWKLILLYHGSLEDVRKDIPFTFTPLLGQFAILRIASPDIQRLLSYPQILYLELSRPLYIEVTTGLSSSCLNASPYLPSQQVVSGTGVNADSRDGLLTGRGTVIAVLDSGVDFRHPDFRNPDGSTRILSYWDQSLPYDGVNPYMTGRIFSEKDLNRLLGLAESADSSDSLPQSLTVSADPPDGLPQPSADISGHGTHVTGICAGNGRSSGGRNHGVAPEASLLIVKLFNEEQSVYSDYASLMMAADYVVKYAMERNLPLSVNVSYGSNNGAHDGNSLLELFFESCIFYGRNTITIATGNEGLSRRHSGAVIQASGNPFYPSYPFPFGVAPGEQGLYLHLWKSPADLYDYQLVTPEQQSLILPGKPGIYRNVLGSNQILASVGAPSPYQAKEEIFISFAGTEENGFISPGIWQFLLLPRLVKSGAVNLWLPVREATNNGTGFLNPVTDMTFTIPSTAGNVISVSGYDSSTDVFASFSGQGFSNPSATKPDLCAPAVNILSTAPGGGYSIRSGTSMAAPFVSGSCALLMQWGIVRGNDPFMFGEKVKAALWKGSKALPAFGQYPNSSVGWGKLCFRDSIPG